MQDKLRELSLIAYSIVLILIGCGVGWAWRWSIEGRDSSDAPHQVIDIDGGGSASIRVGDGIAISFRDLDNVSYVDVVKNGIDFCYLAIGKGTGSIERMIFFYPDYDGSDVVKFDRYTYDEFGVTRHEVSRSTQP